VESHSFSTFRRDEHNREAFRVCREMAELQPVVPQPVLLLGAPGTGKTHLLCAMIGHLQESGAPVGLAYVTPGDLHEEALALLRDPGPLQEIKHAFLLADQIEAFRESSEELESLARLFLSHGHCVVFASNAHPMRLGGLPFTLRSLTCSGQTISLGPHGAHAPHQGESPGLLERMEALERLCMTQAAELDSLRHAHDTLARTLTRFPRPGVSD
jgi:chromosomal replication initiation ATPase DnaA